MTLLPRFPVEPVRDRYVTPFGGYSADLTPGSVGVAAEALARNTKIRADGSEVLVSSEVEGGTRPLFARPFFRVVGLRAEAHPDAARLSPDGEVVFSSEDFGGSRMPLFDRLRPGDLVVLNATLANRLLGPRSLPGDAFGLFARRRFSRGEL